MRNIIHATETKFKQSDYIIVGIDYSNAAAIICVPTFGKVGTYTVFHVNTDMSAFTAVNLKRVYNEVDILVALLKAPVSMQYPKPNYNKSSGFSFDFRGVHIHNNVPLSAIEDFTATRIPSPDTHKGFIRFSFPTHKSIQPNDPLFNTDTLSSKPNAPLVITRPIVTPSQAIELLGIETSWEVDLFDAEIIVGIKDARKSNLEKLSKYEFRKGTGSPISWYEPYYLGEDGSEVLLAPETETIPTVDDMFYGDNDPYYEDEDNYVYTDEDGDAPVTTPKPMKSTSPKPSNPSNPPKVTRVKTLRVKHKR